MNWKIRMVAFVRSCTSIACQLHMTWAPLYQNTVSPYTFCHFHFIVVYNNINIQTEYAILYKFDAYNTVRGELHSVECLLSANVWTTTAVVTLCCALAQAFCWMDSSLGASELSDNHASVYAPNTCTSSTNTFVLSNTTPITFYIKLINHDWTSVAWLTLVI